MQDPTVTTAIIAGICLVLASVPSALVAWLGLRKGREETAKVHAQLVPNGGSSMRDAINRIEKDLGDVKVGLTYLNRRVDHDQ